jgi:LAO/AO transport system kinase
MPSEWVGRLASRDRGAVAEALNLIEDDRPAQREAAAALLSELEGRGSAALRVGITGAPGAGKSTLIDALVRDLRARELSVGILAIDPSSKKSGGALLGDRLRMRSGAGDAGVFLRSMAARDRLGGLSAASRAGV